MSAVVLTVITALEMLLVSSTSGVVVVTPAVLVMRVLLGTTPTR